MFLKSSRGKKEHTDAELISMFKETGDLSHLGILYDRYIHLVYGICLKYLKNKNDSEDAVMQIFEKLITEIPRFEITNLSGWLHVIARNFCLMKLRSFKSKADFDEAFFSSNNMELAQDMHPIDENTLESDVEIMEKCLEELQQEQKDCVDLFYLKEKSYKEIVDLKGYELKKVKSYIQNGKRNMKNCIEDRRENNS